MMDLNVLIDQKIQQIGRAANMFWIAFGELREVPNYRGELVERSEYELHFQCPWRIRSDKAVLLASNDIYCPGTRQRERPLFDFGEIDWDIQGKNLFDERVAAFRGVGPVYVASVYRSPLDDLTIRLSNGTVIESFDNCSEKLEKWRLFCPGEAPNLAVPEDSVVFP